ncbi:MAG: hypothetical protein ACTHOO_07015 [Alcanivorax sp.]
MSYVPQHVKANTNSNFNDAYVKRGTKRSEHVLALRARESKIANVGALIEQLATLCEKAKRQTGNIDYIDLRLVK